MSEDKSLLKDMFESVETLRDELELQMHLAKKEAQDEWESLDERWKELRSRRGDVIDTVDSTARGVLHELQEGFKKLRDAL
jgi:DNA phosphorothioation-dependent restriction protein DptG